MRHALSLVYSLAWCGLMALVTGCASNTSATSTQVLRRYDDIPGAQAVKQAQERSRGLVVSPRLSEVKFAPDGTTVQVKIKQHDDARWRTFDLMDGREIEVQVQEPPKAEPAEAPRSRTNRPKRQRIPRGGQATEVISPDKKWTAVHSDFNVLLRDTDGRNRTITNDGSDKRRYGTASWVYGEELGQRSAMWFSPDSKLLAFYTFDMADVPSYHLLSGLTELRPTVVDSTYPKPGDPNPVVGLQIYDIGIRRMVTVDVGDSEDQYVYGVRFTPDSRHLLYLRMNRLQNALELVRVNPMTGAATVLFSETQPTWVDYEPTIRWLKDGRRFLISTERSGFKTWELWDVDDGQLAVLGSGTFPSRSIVRIDEDDSTPGGGTLYFSGYSDAHPLNLQLHAVHFDGSGLRRLTGESLNHSDFKLAPDGSSVIARATTAEVPPRIVLYGEEGQLLATIAESDTSVLQAAGARPSELFSLEAADGQTCYGRMHFPSNFDASQSWPVLVQVYGGPESSSVRNTFQVSSGRTEFGFVIVQIDNRGTEGRGKTFEGATYLKLGQVDLDDQARGVQVLAERHAWLDTDRVGIAGHSYGGYMSALAILRYPETFSVAVASAPVTDWRNYDSIYTERYMRTPKENGENYDLGSCVKLAEQLQGKLLLLHGMMDDNVHPTNSWQLIQALQLGDIPFQMQLYPNSTHGLRGSASAKWSFLVKHLCGN